MTALRSGLVTLAFLLGLGFAAAQQGENMADPKQNAQQEKAQQTEGGRAGTTEPSSVAPTAKPEETAPFVDGRLTAPGAPADSQTVPAKFSERNAALDELPADLCCELLVVRPHQRPPEEQEVARRQDVDGAPDDVREDDILGVIE